MPAPEQIFNKREGQFAITKQETSSAENREKWACSQASWSLPSAQNTKGSD